MDKIKITVIKKLSIPDLYGDNPPATAMDMTPVCDRFEVGQEFIIEKRPVCPPNFCNWAYADIQGIIAHILYGGSYPWFKEPGVAISCCTDGMRPVFFQIKRIED